MKPGRFRIAHISDLHFGIGFDEALWAHIKTVIEGEQPDIILVTGDLVNSPWPFILVRAYKELQYLAKGTGSTLLVLPGNHDVSISGIARIWPFSGFFRAVFRAVFEGENQKRDWLKRFPSFTEFRRLRRFRRYVRWLSCNLELLLRWVCFQLPDPGKKFFPQFWFENRVFLAFVDSNFRGDLATGYVGDHSFYQIDEKISELRKGKHPSYLWPRILALHHHALAIPYTNTRKGVTSYEPFLVLQNSGTLLKEVWAHDFDLILHGHKHFHSFANIGFGASATNERSLWVLAAGSASVKLDDAGRNSINLIDISPAGRITVRPRFFGGGKTTPLGLKDDERLELRDLVSHKRRIYQRALELQNIDCETLEREVQLDEFGTATVQYGVRGFRVHGDYITQSRTFVVTASFGAVHPHSARLLEPVSTRGLTLTPQESIPKKVMRFKIDFGRHLGASDQVGVSFAVAYRSQNTFMISAWEAKERGLETDFFSVHVRYPCRRLRISLTLPDNLVDPKPFLRCYAARNQKANLDEDNNLAPVLADDWVEDTEVTQHEERCLKSLESSRWVLDVEYPVVGYSYEIRWRVRAHREKDVDPKTVGETIAARERLLSCLAPGSDVGTTRQLLSDQCSETLKLLFGYLRNAYAANDDDETLSLSLMVYDRAAKALVPVKEVRVGPRKEWRPVSLPFGEGVASIAFKKRVAVCHLSPALWPHASAEGLYDSVIPAPGVQEGDNAPAEAGWTAILSVPVFHPVVVTQLYVSEGSSGQQGKMMPCPAETVGVVNFASDSSASRLSILFGQHGGTDLYNVSATINLAIAKILSNSSSQKRYGKKPTRPRPGTRGNRRRA